MSFYRGEESRQSNESNAEHELLLLLHQAYGKMELKERPLTNEALPLKITRPDFYFPGARVAVYLDGPHHINAKVEARDEGINELLEEQDIRALRFRYMPPLTKTKAKEMIEAICKEVNLRWQK